MKHEKGLSTLIGHLHLYPLPSPSKKEHVFLPSAYLMYLSQGQARGSSSTWHRRSQVGNLTWGQTGCAARRYTATNSTAPTTTYATNSTTGTNCVCYATATHWKGTEPSIKISKHVLIVSEKKRLKNNNNNNNVKESRYFPEVLITMQSPKDDALSYYNKLKTSFCHHYPNNYLSRSQEHRKQSN